VRRFSARPRPSQEENTEPAPFSPPLRRSHHRDNEILSLSSDAHAGPNLSERPKIGRLVLVRHGQSEWNVTDPTRNLTARFTGWADIGLTQQGKDQALAAGRAIQLAAKKGILPSRDCTGSNVPVIDVVFCSLLKRSEDTMNIILEEIKLAQRIAPVPLSNGNGEDATSRIPEYQYPIPIIHSWRLNERHYGALVGLSKEGAERLYGKVRLTRWRDSWDVPPPPMPLEMVKRWGREDHCQPVTIVKKGGGGTTCVFDPALMDMQNANGKHNFSRKDTSDSAQPRTRIVEHGGKRKSPSPTANVDGGADGTDVNFMPPSESLRDTYQRFLPLWIQGIAPHLRAGGTVLVVGHANTIRSMIVAIDGSIVTKANVKNVKIPSALPLMYEFVDHDGSCLEVNDKDGIASTTSQSTYPTYSLNGRECSGVIAGNLRVLKPHIDATAKKSKKEEARHQLSGTWVETEETDAVSFCTDLGKKMGEQDIA